MDFYCNGNIVGHIAYDKRGRELGKISYYENGQVHEKKYRKSGSDGWEQSETYVKDGQTLVTDKDLERYINEFKEDDCLR